MIDHQARHVGDPVRTLAIDYGERRIGLALSDEGGRFATPLDVIAVTTVDAAMRQVLELIRREEVRRIVVGLPLNMDDTAGPAAMRIVAWARQLAHQANLPVVFVDERLSSFQADQQLADRRKAGEKLTRKDKKQRQDAIAAASFLQAFLDGKLSPIALPGD